MNLQAHKTFKWYMEIKVINLMCHNYFQIMWFCDKKSKKNRPTAEIFFDC